MNRVYKTLRETSKTLSAKDIPFVLTRFAFEGKKAPNDLDLLVKAKDFENAVGLFKKAGYKSVSHDLALGGRIKRSQINLVKPGRIKIDLHKDFTWRRSHYFNPDLIWKDLKKTKAGEVKCRVPKPGVDAFLVILSIIFEKTYITEKDLDFIKTARKKVFPNPIFKKQAEKYGWGKTYVAFKKWIYRTKYTKKTPLFLPFSLVLFSYWEKFINEKYINLVSLFYYFFFRIRFVVNTGLPYD